MLGSAGGGSEEDDDEDDEDDEEEDDDDDDDEMMALSLTVADVSSLIRAFLTTTVERASLDEEEEEEEVAFASGAFASPLASSFCEFVYDKNPCEKHKTNEKGRKKKTNPGRRWGGSRGTRTRIRTRTR